MIFQDKNIFIYYIFCYDINQNIKYYTHLFFSLCIRELGLRSIAMNHSLFVVVIFFKRYMIGYRHRISRKKKIQKKKRRRINANNIMNRQIKEERVEQRWSPKGIDYHTI